MKNIQQGGDVGADEHVQNIPSKMKPGPKPHTRYVRKGALNGNVYQTSSFPEKEEKFDLLQFFADTKADVENELAIRREKVRDLKWYLNVRVEM